MDLSSFSLIFLHTIYIDYLYMEESLLNVWVDDEDRIKTQQKKKKVFLKVF